MTISFINFDEGGMCSQTTHGVSVPKAKFQNCGLYLFITSKQETLR
jgi:hypothetical protein